MTMKNSRKKDVSARASKGREAFQKGTKFEDTVADLYRLLGAEVIQNVEICQKKVDIFTTFRLPGSPTDHRVIVECKDEKGASAQNQRVMQFKGLLGTARKAGEADSAEIITRVPWSDQAKGFALESGVALLTYAEKVAQLIDFSAYLKNLVEKFEKGDPQRPSEPPLGAYYVDLSAERLTEKRKERIPIIDNYVYQWLRRDHTDKHLAILGEYGTGKTSFCQKLAHDLAASYLNAPGSVRLPILFNLREFTKTLKIEALVTSFLDEECGVTNPRFRLFRAMNDAGNFLLIFDGFDEMAIRVDADTLEINLQEIEKLAASPKSKVILTSRLEYFVSGEEERKCLRPKGRLLATREREYEPLNIVTWDSPQIDSFLEKRVPLIKEAKRPWTYYRDRIRSIPGLSDLSRRPVLLDMIVKTLPRLIASSKPINRPNLYETYLSGEIKRQKIQKQRSLLLSETTRLSLLRQLALDFYTGETSAIEFTDTLGCIEKTVNPPRGELEACTRDFLTCSFLIREGDQYRFSHRSIMEYLVAKALMAEIENDAPDAFARQRLTPVVADFLVELEPKLEKLWDLVETTKAKTEKDPKCLGGNAATLLCLLDRSAFAGKDLSGAVLKGADFNLADLRGVNVNGTVMENVSLVHAQFLREDLAPAKLTDVLISLVILGTLPKLEQGKKRKHNKDKMLGQTHRIMDGLFKQLTTRLHVKPCSTYSTYDGEGHLLITEILRVPDGAHLQLVVTEVAALSWVLAAALYADEREKLLETIPKDLKWHIDVFLRGRTPFFEE